MMQLGPVKGELTPAQRRESGRLSVDPYGLAPRQEGTEAAASVAIVERLRLGTRC